MKKKLIRTLSFFILVISAVFLSCDRDDLFESDFHGTAGPLAWEFTAERALIIRGNGAIPDYDERTFAPWYGYGSRVRSLEIRDGVTSVGSYAFMNYNRVLTLVLPESVTRIGDSAFQYCYRVMEISLPNGIESIGTYAFCGCDGLTHMVLPNGVTAIADYTFGFCENLEGVAIPNGVTKIGVGAFYRCENLNNITIPASVVTIGDRAFGYCSALNDITCLAVTPPELGLDSFEKMAGTLSVPVGSVKAYQASAAWSEAFGTIIAIP